MINFIPILGWILGAACSFFIAVPFYFLWNGLAPTYFFWLPNVYLEVPFWNCVGLFWLLDMVRALLIGQRFLSRSHDSKA